MFERLILPAVAAVTVAASGQRTIANGPARGAGVAGSYEATRVNRKSLPTNDRVEASPGYEHAVKLETMVLTLRGDNRFTAIVKYHQSMVKLRAPAEEGPVMSAAVRGRYTITGTSIRFDPDPDAKGKRVKPVTGTIVGRHITVPFDYKGANSVRHFILELDKNDSIW